MDHPRRPGALLRCGSPVELHAHHVALQLRVGGQVRHETAVSGARWRYSLGYSLSGAGDADVVITADFPDGMWYVGSSAPAGFSESCTQDPVNLWDWSCTWTAKSLDVSGVAGAISVDLRSRAFF